MPRQEWTEEQRKAQAEKMREAWKHRRKHPRKDAQKKDRKVRVQVQAGKPPRTETVGITAHTSNGKVEILKRLISTDSRLATHLYNEAEAFLARG